MKAVGTYAVAQVVSQAAQTEIMAQVDVLMNLLGDAAQINGGVGSGSSAGEPEFDKQDPRLNQQLRAELTALKVAIDAAPIA